MAQKINIVMDQGASFSTTFHLKDENEMTLPLTDYTGYSQFRKHYNSVNAYNFDVALDANGAVTLTASNTVTANVAAGRYVYDVRLVDSDENVARVIEGIVTVTPSVTR